jgi:hypothetical protein
METSPKKHTVESLTELIRQNPEKAFEEVIRMPKEEADVLVEALTSEDYHELVDRAVTNLAASIE